MESKKINELPTPFIGVCLFLYGFTYLLVSIYFRSKFSTTLLIMSLIVALAVAVPLGVSIYFGKKWLNSENPRKIFYKMPLSSIIPSILFSILIEAYLIFFPDAQSHPPLSVLWPFISLVYILCITVISLIFSGYLYKLKFSENRSLLKWIAIILLLIPYIMTIFA